ncbi:MAG: DUF531 family protein [Thermoplasmatota archaeon]
MSRRPKGNDASRFRSLQRDLKEGRGLIQARSSLRSINDPYFRSRSLMAMAASQRAKNSEKKDLLEESLAESRKTEPLWRRGELFSYLFKDCGDLPDELRHQLHGTILDQLRDFRKGEGLSEALTKVARTAPCTLIMDLMETALTNEPEFASKDAKVLVKNWSRRCSRNSDQLEALYLRTLEIADTGERGELLGYIHLQLFNADPKNESGHIFASALSAAMELEGADRLKLISYLSSIAYTGYALQMLVGTIEEFDDIVDRIKASTYISSGADRGGNPDLANRLMDDVLKEVGSVEDAGTRTGLELGIARDLLRLGRKELAHDLVRGIIEHATSDDPIRTVAEILLREERPMKKKEDQDPPNLRSDVRRHILALYDTYEGSIKQVHLRAIARAAPLCYAFDLDLSLIGFPSTNPEDLVDMVKKETNVGKGGDYLIKLLKEKRIISIPASKKDPPRSWKELGLPVATTSKPAKEKTIDMKDAMKIARSKHGRKVVCLVMGLGRQGLPRSLLSSVPYHLELTGSGIPLETATAMGVMVQQLSNCTK